MDLLKLLSASQIFAQVVSFLILFFLLKAFAWKRLLKLLDDRKERISSEFAKIAQEQAKIAELRLSYESGLSAMEAKAKARLEQAAADGQKIIEAVKKEAHTAADGIMKKAEADIKYEVVKARDELKVQIADLAVRAAGRVIEEKITDTVDRRIAEEFLENIDKL